jgi:hypothetical protein
VHLASLAPSHSVTRFRSAANEEMITKHTDEDILSVSFLSHLMSSPVSPSLSPCSEAQLKSPRTSAIAQLVREPKLHRIFFPVFETRRFFLWQRVVVFPPQGTEDQAADRVKVAVCPGFYVVEFGGLDESMGWGCEHGGDGFVDDERPDDEIAFAAPVLLSSTPKARLGPAGSGGVAAAAFPVRLTSG